MTRASKRERPATFVCPVCGKTRPVRDRVDAAIVTPAMQAAIRADHPDWPGDGVLCTTDLRRYRIAQVQEVLREQKGEVSELDRTVLERMRDSELIATNVEPSFEAQMSLGERVADKVAGFGGSWTFIGVFFAVLVAWMIVNTVVLGSRPFDPYPFILLNLILSCVAAIQAPVIMMSQNRQESKDRVRAEHDYQVNLKAELEIRLLHEKLDHLLLHEWQGLLEIQKLQTDMIDELTSSLDELRNKSRR